MEKIKTFSLKRIFYLIQNEIYTNFKFVLIGYSALFGIYAFLLILSALKSPSSWDYFADYYTVGLFIAGFFVSGMAFTSFRTKEKTITYLSLPASLLEKLISMLIVTTLGFLVSYTVLFYAFQLFMLGIGSIAFDLQPEFINIFNEDILSKILLYLIIQPIFLVGAATFRKIPVFYTFLILFASGMLLTILAISLAAYIKETMDITLINNTQITHNGYTWDLQQDHYLFTIAKYLFYWATAPVFWIITYLKLKEKQV